MHFQETREEQKKKKQQQEEEKNKMATEKTNNMAMNIYRNTLVMRKSKKDRFR